MSPGVSSVWVLRLQSALHGRHPTPLVQSAGVGEPRCLPQKETRDSYQSGAIVGLRVDTYLHVYFCWEEFRQLKDFFCFKLFSKINSLLVESANSFISELFNS